MLLRKIFFSLILVSLAPSIQANLMPSGESLKTRESTHFQYIYQASLSQRVPELAKHCEDAYALLSPLFNWQPDTKITVMYADHVDLHNGLATAFPEPRMMIFAGKSLSGSSIFEASNEMRRTVFHEMAHVLSLDAQYGVDKVVSDIFGRVLPSGDLLSLIIAGIATPPGSLAPDWFQEGLATWVETEFVGPGRGQNAASEMVLRLAAAEGRLLRPGEWSRDYPSWPFGHSVYQYGARVMRHAGHKDQANTPAALADEVAHSWSYFFDRAAKQTTGKSFNQLARQSLVAERERQMARIAQLQTQALTKLPRITQKSAQAWSPQWLNNRQIVFPASEEENHPALYVYDLESRRSHKLAKRSSGSITSVAVNNGWVYFTRLDGQGKDQVRSRLWRVSSDGGKLESLGIVKGLRYLASGDQNQIFAVRSVASGDQLISLNIADGRIHNSRTLFTAEPNQAIVDPSWHRRQGLAFIINGQNQSQLMQLKPKAKRVSPRLVLDGIAAGLSWHPGGEKLLLSHDQNGVFNLYQLSNGQQRLTSVSHTLGGLFEASYAPNGQFAAAIAYDSHGFYLTTLDGSTLTPRRRRPPQLSNDWRISEINRSNIAKQAQQPAPVLSAEEDYWSLSGLQFDYWTPWLTAGPNGGIAGGILTSVSDMTGYQQGLLVAGKESEYDSNIAAFSWAYTGSRINWAFRASTAATAHSELVTTNSGRLYDYVEQVDSLGVFASLPFARADYQLILSTGLQAREREAISAAADDYANESVTRERLFSGNDNAFNISASYFDGDVYPRSVSPERGRLISLAGEIVSESLGADINQRRLRGDYAEYIAMPFANNHVLKLAASYASGNGDTTAQGLFGIGGFAALPFADSAAGLNRNLGIRGYDNNTARGSRAGRVELAYRAPLLNWYKGPNATLPIYFRNLTIEGYAEAAKILDDDNESEWLPAFGAEVNFGMNLMRGLALAPGLGIVYASKKEDDIDTEEDERLQLYISIRGGVNF